LQAPLVPGDGKLAALVESLARELGAHGWKLATAESCTGGWIAKCCTDRAGSSAWFDRGFVTYSNAAKRDMLGVDGETLETAGAVSEPTVLAMAAGALAHSEAGLALAISGIAGPGGATDDKPVGTVCMGLADASAVNGYRFNFTFDNRRMNKRVFATAALDLLRRHLLGIPC